MGVEAAARTFDVLPPKWESLRDYWESRDSVFDFSFLSVLLMIGINFWILLSVVTFKRKSCEAVAHAASTPIWEAKRPMFWPPRAVPYYV